MFPGTILNHLIPQILVKSYFFSVFNYCGVWFVGDTKSQFVQSFNNMHCIKNNALSSILTFESKLFTITQYRKNIRKNFHSIPIEVRDMQGALIQFLSAGSVKLTLQNCSLRLTLGKTFFVEM